MKKYFIVFLSFSMALMLFAACNGNAPGSSSVSEPDQATSASAPAGGEGGGTVYTISVGDTHQMDFDEVRAFYYMDELLQQRTGGRLKLDIYPASQLGTEREMAEQVMLGTLDICLSDGPTWSNTLNIPELAVWGLPFLYEDLDSMYAVASEVMIPAAAEMMEGSGVTPLFALNNGIRQAFTNTHPIATAGDIKGIKMRVPEIALYVDTWTALGANATTTPWSEAYTSLAQHVVDGVEVDVSGLTDSNLQETVKYMSMTNHMGVIHIISMNTQRWQSIPQDLRDIFLETADEVMQWQFNERKMSIQAQTQQIRDAGVAINEIAPEERAKMIEMVQPLYQTYTEEYGLAGLIDSIREVTAK